MSKIIKNNLNYILTIITILGIMFSGYIFTIDVVKENTINNQKILSKIELFANKFKETKENTEKIKSNMQRHLENSNQMKILINTNFNRINAIEKRVTRLEK